MASLSSRTRRPLRADHEGTADPEIASTGEEVFALAFAHLDSPDKDVRNLATALCLHFEGSLRSSIRKVWNPPTTLPSARFDALCNGERSASEAAAHKVN